MTRMLWPGIVFVLVGSLVVLHAATLVYAVSARPGAPGPATTARPRAGWVVAVGRAPDRDGGGILVELADAGGSPIRDAAVSLAVATSAPAPLACDAPGRFRSAVAVPPGTAVRVVVRRSERVYSFDRVVQAAAEAAP
jgi:hypothetical protein